MQTDLSIASLLDRFSIGFCYVNQNTFDYNKPIETWLTEQGWSPEELAARLRKWAADGELLHRTGDILWEGRMLAEHVVLPGLFFHGRLETTMSPQSMNIYTQN
jgi:arylamine N-acetyltransferase